MMSRSRDVVTALYEPVESVLAGNIADGSLPPAQVPSEGGLVERFEVSCTTVRKAIHNLVERGLVEVRGGKGTFVTQPRIRCSTPSFTCLCCCSLAMFTPVASRAGGHWAATEADQGGEVLTEFRPMTGYGSYVRRLNRCRSGDGECCGG